MLSTKNDVQHTKQYYIRKKKGWKLLPSTLKHAVNLFLTEDKIAYCQKHYSKMPWKHSQTGKPVYMLHILPRTIIEVALDVDARVAKVLRIQNIFNTNTRAFRYALYRFILPPHIAKALREGKEKREIIHNYYFLRLPNSIKEHTNDDINSGAYLKRATSGSVPDNFFQYFKVLYTHWMLNRNKNEKFRHVRYDMVADTPLETVPTWWLEHQIAPLFRSKEEYKNTWQTYEFFYPYFIHSSIKYRTLLAISKTIFYGYSLSSDIRRLLKFIFLQGHSIEVALYYVYLHSPFHALPIAAPYRLEEQTNHNATLLKTFLAGIIAPWYLFHTVLPNIYDLQIIVSDWIKIAPIVLRQLEVNYLRFIKPTLVDFYNWYATLLMLLSHKFIFGKTYHKVKNNTSWQPFVDIITSLSAKQRELLLSSEGRELAQELYEKTLTD